MNHSPGRSRLRPILQEDLYSGCIEAAIFTYHDQFSYLSINILYLDFEENMSEDTLLTLSLEA
jgi:type IV secretory pathway VirB4 component